MKYTARSKYYWGYFAVPLGILLVSCQTNLDDAALDLSRGHNPRGIRNGDLVAGNQFDRVGALIDTTTTGLCTGTLLCKNVVLTASHCIKPNMTPSNTSFIITRDVSSLKNTRTMQEFFEEKNKLCGRSMLCSRVKSVTRLSDKEGEADLALAVLEKDAPFEDFPDLARQQPNIGNIGTAVGYGSDERGVPGLKHWTTFPMWRIGSDKFDFAGLNTLVFGDPQGVKAIDHGDSGGPIFVNGEIAGVASFKTITPGNIYANVARNREWILKRALEYCVKCQITIRTNTNSNSTPPVVTLSGNSATAEGTATLSFQVSNIPPSWSSVDGPLSVEFLLQDFALSEIDKKKLSLPDRSGTYSAQVSATWKGGGVNEIDHIFTDFRFRELPLWTSIKYIKVIGSEYCPSNPEGICPRSSAALTIDRQISSPAQVWRPSPNQDTRTCPGGRVVTCKGYDGRFYRAYNATSDGHFFTTSYSEFVNAVNNGYADEGSRDPIYLFTSESEGRIPVFRLYNPSAGRHYYTQNSRERNFLTNHGWRYEKIEGYVLTHRIRGNELELYRLYNKNSGAHLYTTNSVIKDNILRQYRGVWEQHSSLGYANGLNP